MRDDGEIDGALHLVGVDGNRPPVARLLEILGLRAELDVHDDLAALLDALRSSC